MNLICRLRGHRFQLFKAYRLGLGAYVGSVVHQVRCVRCAKVKGYK